MNLIEQATKRLEELRNAGVDVPWAAVGVKEGAAVVTLGDGARAARTRPMMASEPAAAVAPDAVPAARSIKARVDLDALGASGYLVPELVRSDLARQFRTIKRPLLKNALRQEPSADRRAALIMVTSAVPGEGKTFCALNLAMSMAMEVDTSVLLVDADVLRPAILPRLGLPLSRGLLDVLVDPELPLSDVMLRTNVEKLSLLSAGTQNEKSSELLASAAMEKLLHELATKYTDRVIIFDAPPLLSTTEARVLASNMGQVVMVVEASKTPKELVQRAFDAVAQCPAVLAVLNKSRTASALDRYDSYYG